MKQKNRLANENYAHNPFLARAGKGMIEIKTELASWISVI